MRDCYIVGAGEFAPRRFRPRAGDYVIAADAGLRYLEQLGVAPSLTLGDFDSLGAAPEGDNVEISPVEKDDTDMLIAVKRALEMGFDRILIFGGTGGRLDHTLANLQTLALASRKGAEAFMFGDGFIITALTDGVLRFPDGWSGTFSVFSHGDRAVGVSESGGVKYPLRSVRLSGSYPLGVSNNFTGGPTEISVKQGTLIIYWEDVTPSPLPERSSTRKV